ncbi:MAG: DNA ligase D [Flavitalea sp.]
MPINKAKAKGPLRKPEKSISSASKAKPSKSPNPIPVSISPMLATLVDKPFDKEGWLYEVKWDGYRAIAFVDGKNVELRSRNDKSFNDKFYPVPESLSKLAMKAVLDGEIVVVDEKGHADFGSLQNWRSEADGDLRFYVFDLLWVNGKSLLDEPLSERRKALVKLLPKNHDTIMLSDDFKATGTEFFEMAKEMNLEGIIAKKADSIYVAGARSPDWLKIKTSKRQEVIIGGYTTNDGSNKVFSSLLVGVMEKGKLQYTGKIGTGFSQKLQKEMMKQFKPLVRKTAPFASVPDINKPSRFRPDPPKAQATWLKPELICEVTFREMTADGVMRHPSFEGMREDKKAKDVVAEKAKSTKEVLKKTPSSKDNTSKPDSSTLFKSSLKTDRRSLLNPSEEQQVRKINGHDLTFTNLSKKYWPKEGYTKRDMLNYYYQVAPYILPYLKDRPQSLNRHPNGITGKSFYQKDVRGKAPEWIETFPYHSEADNRDKEFLVCSNEASLLYMASLGTIEMNPWSSRISKPENPDWCIIDLDPDKNKFDQVVEAALATHEVLEALKVPSYCKTSGSTGLHIYVPLGAKYDYEHSKEFARVIVTLVHQRLPKFTSIERPTAKRKGKIYLDFLQNRPQATLAAPYSVRPKPFAPVSMPLEWKEVKKGLKIEDFTIVNAIARLKQNGDIFKPVLGKGIDMRKALQELEKM